MSNAAMHEQLDSRLLSMPAELRRAVYQDLIPPSIHIFPSPQGRLAVSVCLGPPASPSLVDDYYFGGHERGPARGSPKKYDSPYSRWQRRTRSSWGAHWECEEAACAKQRYHIGDLLSVCKKMFFDLGDIVFESAVINVTDLEVLEVLTREPLDKATGPGNLWDWMAGDSIRRLNVTFRLPLPTYEALERAHSEGPLAISSQLDSWDGTDAACATWASVWPAVCWLPKLRHLHVWLEVDENRPWSVVRERQAVGDGVMAVLAANLQARARHDLPHTDVLFHLPQLHPDWARPDTHFITKSPPSPFSTERRFRLRFPATKDLVQLRHGRDGYGDNKQQVKSTREWLWKRGPYINKKYFLEVLPGSRSNNWMGSRFPQQQLDGFLLMNSADP